jgi:DNA-binding transcriptional regulator YiaG
MMPTAQEIHETRKAQRLTLKDFAAILGVSVATLGRWERDEARPRGLQAKNLERTITHYRAHPLPAAPVDPT